MLQRNRSENYSKKQKPNFVTFEFPIANDVSKSRNKLILDFFRK